jgi:molecular chaperone Hsp33
MLRMSNATPPANTPGQQDDALLRFLLPAAGVRGAWVGLAVAWRELQGHGSPHPALTPRLGEAVAASALLTAHVKVAGRLTLQLRSPGPLATVFAETTAAGTVRGIVRGDGDAVARTAGGLPVLAPAGVLAVTIENPSSRGDDARYQGLVPLVGDDLAGAFEDYFERSEQLPTRLLLAADAGHACGLLLQKLPGDSGDTDGWERAQALFATLARDELLTTPGPILLHRLFHEERPELVARRALRFACSCSHERVADMLRALGPDEARAAVQADGQVEVHCEFCGRAYHFDADAIEALFRPHGGSPAVAAARRLQ